MTFLQDFNVFFFFFLIANITLNAMFIILLFKIITIKMLFFFIFRYVGEIITDQKANDLKEDSYLFNLENPVSRFYISNYN